MEKKTVQHDVEQVPVKIWNGAFARLFITNIMLNLGQQMMNSLVAKYADSLGAKAIVVGVVSGVFAVTALIMKVISGPAIDTFNRKYILTGATIILAVSFLGYGISRNIPVLIAFRLLQGCGKAFTATCCLAMAADTLPAQKFASGIGIYSLAQVICQALGPTFGLALAELFGYSLTFFIGSFITMFAIFPIMQIKTLQKNQETKFKITLDQIVAKEAIGSSIIMFLLTATAVVTNSFRIVIATRQGIKNIGYFFTVYAVAMLFTRPIVGKLNDRFGLVVIIIPSMCMFIISHFILSAADTLPLYLIAALVASIGYGVCQPMIQTLCMKSVSKERRGAASSTNYIANDLGSLVGPVLAGAVADSGGYIFMWRIMTIPVFLAMLITICSRRGIAGMENKFQNDFMKIDKT
jgi:MFS family permease